MYRSEFRPSEQLERPHVIAGVNVIAADSEAEARAQHERVRRGRVRLFVARDRRLSDDEAEALLGSPVGRQVDEMMRYSAIGAPGAVVEYLDGFARHADADELIVVHASPAVEARLRSVELLAQALDLAR